MSEVVSALTEPVEMSQWVPNLMRCSKIVSCGDSEQVQNIVYKPSFVFKARNFVKKQLLMVDPEDENRHIVYKSSVSMSAAAELVPDSS